MQIRALAQATGVDVETIRFYEKQGLLPSPARLDNGYRNYSSAHLERLAFIRHCRALDLPLADIRQLLAWHDAPASRGEEADALIDAQLRRVRARLISLQALEQQLLRLRAACQHGPQPDHHTGRECGILQTLVAAAHGEACACHSVGGTDLAPSAGPAVNQAAPAHPDT